MADEIKQTAELRRSGLGGSDMATVMGLNPYKSAYELWAEKTGLIEPDDLSDNDVVWFGSASEDLHAKFFERRTGIALFKPTQTFRLRGSEHLMAHPDRLTVSPGGAEPPTVVELKTTDYFGLRDWGEEGSDEVPQWYIPQVMTYLLVLDAPYAIVSVLAGRRIQTYELQRSATWDAAILEAADAFWDLVQRRVEPNMDYDALTLSALRKVYPRAQAKSMVMADKRIEALIGLKADIAKRARDLKAQQDAVDAELAHFARDNEFVLIENTDQCLHKVVVGETVVPSYVRKGYSYLRSAKVPKDVARFIEQQRALGLPYVQERIEKDE